jgi:hypothetical protein
MLNVTLAEDELRQNFGDPKIHADSRREILLGAGKSRTETRRIYSAVPESSGRP